MNNKINNKGFTLVELLATIAILAIIAVISFVSINGVMSQNDVKNCENLVNNIKSAAREYVSDERYKSSFVNDVDSSMKISFSASKLIGNKYLSGDIYNPFDDSDNVSDKVVIDIQLNDDYTAKKVDVYVNKNANDALEDDEKFSCIQEWWQ